MPEQRSLTVNVNAGFTVDAGSWQECVEEDQAPHRLVSPPHATMYRQVLSYLEESTRGEKIPPKSQVHFGEVAIATAICRSGRPPTIPRSVASATGRWRASIS